MQDERELWNCRFFDKVVLQVVEYGMWRFCFAACQAILYIFHSVTIYIIYLFHLSIEIPSGARTIVLLYHRSSDSRLHRLQTHLYSSQTLSSFSVHKYGTSLANTTEEMISMAKKQNSIHFIFEDVSWLWNEYISFFPHGWMVYLFPRWTNQFDAIRLWKFNTLALDSVFLCSYSK